MISLIVSIIDLGCLLVATFLSIKGAKNKNKSDILHANGDKTMGNGFKLKEGKFRLDVVGNSLLRLARPWQCCPLPRMGPWAGLNW